MTATECIDDNTLAEYLARTLDATALARVTAHLDACDACMTVACAAAATDDALPCLAAVALLEHGDITLTGAEESQLARHLATCAACRRRAEATAAAGRRAVVHVPDGALDADALVLATVDPRLFAPDQQIAAGGMGRITRARDRRLGRDVAIKEVLDRDLLPRFEREIAITAKLQHPAIVTIYEAGVWPSGAPFYTMRLVPGRTLGRAIAGATTLEARLALLPAAAAATDALAYAHARGVIHRDLKPDNVLVGDYGETVVIDWGLAKELDAPDPVVPAPARASSGDATELTQSGSVLGTPGFMPPEQAAGGPLDARADVYALGAILYNVIAGEAPYHDDRSLTTPTQLVAAAQARPPTPIAKREPRVPRDLQALVERAMARAPADRFRDAGELAAELRRFLAGQLLASRTYGARELVARWLRRHRGIVAVAGLALVALVAVGVVSVTRIARARDAEHGARVAAEDAQAKAEASAAAQLEELGRDALLGGDPERGLAYLAEAYRRGWDTVALRHLLAIATRDLAPPTRRLATHDQARVLGWISGGRLVTLAQRRHAIAIVAADGSSRDVPLDAAVGAAQVTPDGTRVAVLGNHGVALWDLERGARLWQVEEPDADGADLVVDPSGDVLAVVGAEAPGVALYALATGAVVRRLATSDTVDAVAFSPDGALVATGGRHGALQVWRRDTGALVASVAVPTGPVLLAFAGPEHVVAPMAGGEIYLWELARPTASVLSGHGSEVRVIAVAPSGRRFATGDRDGGVRLWSADGKRLGASAEAHSEISVLAFSPDGTLLLGGGDDLRAFVWSDALGMRAALGSPAEAFEDGLDSAAWAPDSRAFATARSDGSLIHVWQAPRGDEIARAHVTAVAVGARVVVTAAAGELTVLDTTTGAGRTGAVLHRQPSDWRWTIALRPPLQISADGSRALVWDETFADVYDLSTGALLRELAPAGRRPFRSCLLSADGRRVVELAATDRVVEVETGAVLLARSHDGEGDDGDLSPAGDQLVVGGRMLAAWTVPEGGAGPVPALAPDHGATAGVRFDTTGARYATLHTASALVVAAASGAVLAELPSPRGEVDDVALDAAGTTAAVLAADESVTLWDLSRRATLFSQPRIGAMALAHDGARLATGGTDGVIRIWDRAGRVLETIGGHQRRIASVTFSADDSRLVIFDGHEVSVVDVHLEQRSPAAISALAAAATSWRVADGVLVRR